VLAGTGSTQHNGVSFSVIEGTVVRAKARALNASQDPSCWG
jgi:hypothetical protein